ncbi:MAG: hypothetical protein NZ700_12140 [Gemmataceae bacterium]|nr:hypothetical protein [Gemmataceae bacterium]MDW8265015.1 DUF6580 family putative transport protein [Gemmataceae bacterium]
MLKQLNRGRMILLVAMVLAAAGYRLVPHPPNFGPVTALALFGGAHFPDRRLALLVPLAAMFLSDLVLGLHGLVPVTYACFALSVCLGWWVRRRQNPGRIAVATLASSVLFYVVTNFAVWAWTDLYPRTESGLVACYVAALPFFRNALAGDFLFTTVLFGSVAAAEQRLPQLRPAAV